MPQYNVTLEPKIGDVFSLNEEEGGSQMACGESSDDNPIPGRLIHSCDLANQPGAKALVLVEWNDPSTCNNGLQTLDEAFTHSTTRIEQAAFYLGEKDDKIYLAQDWIEGDFVRDITILPKGVIERIRELRLDGELRDNSVGGKVGEARQKEQ
jgi:hypothetical protein